MQMWHSTLIWQVRATRQFATLHAVPDARNVAICHAAFVVPAQRGKLPRCTLFRTHATWQFATLHPSCVFKVMWHIMSQGSFRICIALAIVTPDAHPPSLQPRTTLNPTSPLTRNTHRTPWRSGQLTVRRDPRRELSSRAGHGPYRPQTLSFPGWGVATSCCFHMLCPAHIPSALLKRRKNCHTPEPFCSIHCD